MTVGQCDERRPRCVNCQTAGFECVYAASVPTPPTAALESESSTATVSASSTPDERTGELSLSNVVPDYTPSEPLESNLNMQHLELLHQFIIKTYKTFSTDDSVQDIWKGSVVRMALSFPYLMQELLAISALHLAYLKPEHSTWYYTRSTELQSQALNSFNSVQRDIDASSCAPVLIFTSLLAVHVLADPSRTMGLDSNQYLDHVIHCIMLMRNVQKLIIYDWYEYLKETELKPLFGVRQPPKPYQIPQPCLDLAKLTHNSDLAEEAKETYDTAIERLQWIYAVSNVPYQTHCTVRWLLAWPIQLNAAYQDRLNQRRPESLVILAYYAVLLMFYRECWAVGDSGIFLIRAISSHLGPHWATWMEWPNSFVTTPDDTG